MGLDDIFEYGQKDRKNRYGSDYKNDDHHHREQSDSGHFDTKQMLLAKLKNNPKLKALLVFAILFIIMIAIIALIFLFPALMKLVGFIGENGVKGLFNAIWSGSK